MPVLTHLLRTRRKALGLWALSLAAVCGMYTSMYPYLSGMDIEAMLAAFPPAMMEALGYDDLGTAAGYIGSATYGLVALALLLVFAIGQGGSLLAGQEEEGALELELTSPAPRATIYTQRLAGLWLQLTALVAVVYGVTLLINAIQQLQLPFGKLSAATLQLLLLVGFFGSTAFAVGAATGRKGAALGAGAALAVTSWMFNAIGPTVDQKWMAKVSPVGWYMDDNPITRGFHPVDLGLLVAVSAVVVVLGWLRYRRRDLMT